jgi:hypothetical protein
MDYEKESQFIDDCITIFDGKDSSHLPEVLKYLNDRAKRYYKIDDETLDEYYRLKRLRLDKEGKQHIYAKPPSCIKYGDRAMIDEAIENVKKIKILS